MKKLVGKRIICMIICLAMIVSTNGIFAAENVGISEKSGGGTPIYTTEDLCAIKNNPDGNYVLMNDIVFEQKDFDEGGKFYNDGHGWKGFDFSGSLNGNGHCIRGLKIYYNWEKDKLTITNVGLFHQNSGLISNLDLKDISIFQRMGSRDVMHYAGAICAVNEGKIVKCNVEGDFNVQVYSGGHYTQGESYAGCIAGENRGKIDHCETRGEFSGFNNGTEGADKNFCIGTISGNNTETGEISNCKNQMTCTVGESSVAFGGICGRNQNKIFGCENLGKIKGTTWPWARQFFSGICGKNFGTIEESANFGEVDITGVGNSGWSFSITAFGGISGYGATGSLISNCQNNATVKWLSENGSGSGTIGGWYTGGILGYSDNAQIVGCHNAGKLSTYGKVSSISPRGGDIKDCTYLFGCPDDTRATVVGETYDPNQFNYYIYRADWTMHDQVGLRVADHLNDDTPGEVLNQSLEENALFKNSAAAWEAMEVAFNTLDKGTGIPDYCYERKEVYAAIIWDVLQTVAERDMIKPRKSKYHEAIQKSKEVVDKFSKAHNVMINTKEDFQNLAEDLKLELGEDLLKYFVVSEEVLDSLGDWHKIINSAMKIADDFDTFCEQAYIGAMLLEMEHSEKYIINQMYQNCPDEQKYMKEALKTCSDIMDMTLSEYYKSAEEKAWGYMGKEAVKLAFQQFWSVGKSLIQGGFPWIDLFIQAYNKSKAVSNFLFDVDAKDEQYHKVAAVVEYEKVLRSTVNEIKDKYQSNKGALKAEIYLNGIDLSYIFREKDCIEAKNFFSACDKGLLNKIRKWLGYQDNMDMAQIYREKQKVYNDLYHDFCTKWLNNLQKDYPEEYEKYKDITENKLVKKVEIACPVDVYVYDQADNLVGYVVGSTAWCDDSISLEVVGDQKNVFFYDHEIYKIKYVGNDTGTMDVTFTEYDTEESLKRTVNFYNLALSEGKTYQGETKGSILDETTYVITDEQKTIKADFDSLLGSATQKKSKATIKGGYLALEEGICQEKQYHANESVEIRAIIPKNKEFVRWEASNGENIFHDETDIHTTFIMPEMDVEITAVMKDPKGDSPAPPISSGGTSQASEKRISASCGSEGTITPMGECKVLIGRDQTFKITPNDGYEVAEVLVDGKNIGAVTSYTFEKVTTDHTISATFKKKESVNPTDDPNGITAKIKAAKSVKIKASSSQGKNKKGKRYIKVKWTKKGAKVSGYQVYRSEKKKSGYKKFFTTKKKYYYNTKLLKKGKRYYYKVRAYTVINGKKYYSGWSNLAYRTVKKG